MKKLIAAILSLGMALSVGANAFAEANPKIMWGEREVYLDAPAGEFADGVFMMPVRRLAEMAGARVRWDENKRMVQIDSSNNVIRLFLYLDKTELQIFTFTSIVTGESTYEPYEAQIKIVNNRTMVPFEQIAKALKMEYSWNEDKTGLTVKQPIENPEKRVEMSLSVDKEDVNAGDEVTVSVVASNLDLYEGGSIAGYSVGIIYDYDEFEVVSGCLCGEDGNKFDGAAEALNPTLFDDSLKAIYLTTTNIKFSEASATVGKIVLKAKTDNGGTIRLSERINSRGYDSRLILLKPDEKKPSTFENEADLELVVDDIVIK